MAKTTTWAEGLLDLVFNNIAFTGLGDAGGLLPSATAGSLYVSLHTSDPGLASDQTTNEVAYTSYARMAVTRSGGAWIRTGNQVSPATPIIFPLVTGGSGPVAFYVGIGTASSGTGKLMYRLKILSPVTGVACGVGATPTLATAMLVLER